MFDNIKSKLQNAFGKKPSTDGMMMKKMPTEMPKTNMPKSPEGKKFPQKQAPMMPGTTPRKYPGLMPKDNMPADKQKKMREYLKGTKTRIA